MKKYYIHDGHAQLGPFSASELIEKKITACTPVFTNELGRYVTASEIPELCGTFKNSVYSLKNTVAVSTVKKNNSSFKKKLGWTLVATLSAIIVIILFNIFQVEVPDSSPDLSTAAAVIKQDELTLKTALEQKETANPTQYLYVHCKMHNNLLGKKIIKGKVTNLASIAGYKDLQMSVVFLSANQTELQTQQFFVNDEVAPNGEISFRNVFKAPDETEAFRLKIISATPTH